MRTRRAWLDSAKPMNFQFARRVAGPFLVSLAAAAALMYSVDLSEFHGLSSRIRLQILPEIFAIVLGLVLLVGLRWHMLLRMKGKWRPALVAAAIGLGGNQVLPARGGDIVRVVLSARWSAASVHQTLSALFIEKLIDLFAVGAVGAITLGFLLGANGDGAPRNAALLICAGLLPSVCVFLVLTRLGITRRLLAVSARWLHLSPAWYRHAYRPIFHLERASTSRALAAPLALTAAMWLGPYTYAFFRIPELIGVHVAWTDAMVLLFVTSIGLALPAAPSGVGTLHVAVVSGFLLIGRGAAEGLVVAAVIHLVFFAGFGLFGLVGLALVPSQDRIQRESAGLP